jgi:hypothetical protein
MGQIPDPDYDPHSLHPRCYYSREERLSLPNAPATLKKRPKKFMKLTIFISILVVTIIWMDSSGKQILWFADATSVEHTEGRYSYRLSREVREGSLEARFIIRLRNDGSFRLPQGVPVYVSFESARATNLVIAPLIHEGVELPLHVFSVSIPFRAGADGTGATRIRASYPGGAGVPGVDLVLE